MQKICNSQKAACINELPSIKLGSHEKLSANYVHTAAALCCIADLTHLSKRLSDPRQNGTQEKTPFSGTAFHTLSHGVIRFVTKPPSTG